MPARPVFDWMSEPLDEKWDLIRIWLINNYKDAPIETPDELTGRKWSLDAANRARNKSILHVSKTSKMLADLEFEENAPLAVASAI